MKPETQNRIAAFYKKEVESIHTPPLPKRLTESVGIPGNTPISPSTTTVITSNVFEAGNPVNGNASHTFRRRLASEFARIALTAAIVSGAILLPSNQSINPVSLGIDRLFTDSVLKNSVSKNLLNAALMIGKSIAKE